MSAHAYPNDWLALLLTVFMLGVRHGMDADHLATIDGIARSNAARRPRLSRWSGFLFSLGHGSVVMAIAVLAGLASNAWSTPAWLERSGAWISIAFLLFIGGLNLANAWRTPPAQRVVLTGVKSRVFAALTGVSHPLLIASVGALFALSFDTVSQVALFSMTASGMSGMTFCVTAGVAFTLGMLTTDGINGLWIARLIARADRRALAASRLMAFTIGGLSVLVGLYGAACLAAPAFAAHGAVMEFALGAAVVAVVAVSAMLAARLYGAPASVPESAARPRRG